MSIIKWSVLTHSIWLAGFKNVLYEFYSRMWYILWTVIHFKLATYFSSQLKSCWDTLARKLAVNSEYNFYHGCLIASDVEDV